MGSWDLLLVVAWIDPTLSRSPLSPALIPLFMSTNLLEAHLARTQSRLEKAETPARTTKCGLDRAKEEIAAKRRKVEETIDFMAKEPRRKSRKLVKQVLKECRTR